MSQNILVQLNLGSPVTLPAAIATRLVTVTDSAGASQNASLTGAESPAWSTTFSSLADGAVTGTVQDQDASGNAVGSPVSFNFAGSGGGTVTGQPTASVTVTAA